MRFHKENPVTYYVIGVAAMGVVVVYITTAMLHRHAAYVSKELMISESTITEKDSKEKDTETVDEEDDNMKNAWKLLLVNADNPLSSDYEENLKLVSIRGEIMVDERIYDALQQMLDDCRETEREPLVCSGYRSVAKQQDLYDTKVASYVQQGYSQYQAREEAAKWVTVPGTSEHHTGMAVDIVSVGNQRLEQEQEDTREQKWLMAHCDEYGFILRYPSDKEDITGIHYEPWHYRYVGKKAAKYIKEHNLCLEEYVEKCVMRN